MAKYPDRRSAAIPALCARRRSRYGWCSPEGVEQAAVRDAADAGLPDVPSRLLRHARDASPSAATASTCARTSRARCAAPTSSSTRCCEEAGDDADFNVRGFECLGACDIAPMASVNGAVRRPARRSTRCRTIVQQIQRRRSEVLPDKQLAAPPTSQRPTPEARPRVDEPTDDDLLFEDIDEPGLNTLDGLRAARRLRVRCARRWPCRREEVVDDARGVRPARPRRRRLPDGQEGVVPPEGRRWRSTSSATPTSPSPARSRTAS